MGICACFLPIWGVLTFTFSPKLWVHIFCPFLVAIGGTIAALVLLWEYVEAPQKLLLEQLGLPDAASVVLAVILVPVEAALINLIIFQLLFGQVAAGITATVLSDRGVDKKLLQRYGVDRLSAPGGGPLSGACSSGFFVALQLVLMVLTAPMHTVAGPGQFAWVLANGWIRTWDLVAELLPLIGYRSSGSQFGHVFSHMVSYVGFGAVAFAFELIPFANVFLVGGNAVGAAFLFEEFVDRWEQGPDALPVPVSNGNNWRGPPQNVARAPQPGYRLVPPPGAAASKLPTQQPGCCGCVPSNAMGH